MNTVVKFTMIQFRINSTEWQLVMSYIMIVIVNFFVSVGDMRISPKRVLFNKLWLYTFLLNVSIVYYYYAKFPLMKFPLIMYPITATMSIVNPMWHWLVPDGLKKGLSSSFSYLHYIPNLAVGYRTKYEGKLITMEHGSFSKKVIRFLLNFY